MYRTRRKSGFTLVEILIVVIILGILAAIVIPQFTNASQDARKSNLASQVQTLKSQIELFKLQHHDTAPTLQTNWDQFLYCTKDDGTVSPTQAVVPDQVTGFIYGPYMQAKPSDPLVPAANGTVVGAAGTVDGSCGWTYTPASGVIHGIGIGSDGTTFYETDDGVNQLSGTPIP